MIIHEWMNGCVYEWMDKWIDGCVDGDWIDGRMDGWMGV